MKRIELLAPAGNMDCLKQAINNGADAVYLGGTSFSARAFAGNFNNEEIKEAVKYAHLRNSKIYVTLNTLLNENELENAIKQAKYYYDINVDALLVQDLGLFYRLRELLPDFEIHASTQMHVHNLDGVKACKKLGFKRVVVARETSLEMIKEFTKEDIEIECFVHGAICVSYSGECLMSSVINNRSANKGMCAQCCRLAYEIYDKNNNRIKTDTEYLLSTKDMFLLKDIKDLIEANVSSLKIEGRMKSPAYVGYVTKLYRRAIDSYYENKQFSITTEEINNLKVLYNRDFTNSYLKNDSKDIFSNIRPNHMGISIGKVIKFYDNIAFIKLNKEVNQFDGIRIINSHKDTGTILNMLKVNGKLKDHANSGDVIEINVKDKVNIGDNVVKTLDSKFENLLSNYDLKKNDISLDIHLSINKPIKILTSINDSIYEYIGKINFLEAISKPITKENIINQFLKTGDHPYNIINININIEDDVFLPISKINEIRRDFYIELDNYILNTFKRLKLIKDINYININNIQFEDIINDYKYTDVINKDSSYPKDNIIVNEIGGLFKDNAKIAGYTMNVYNSYAFEFLLKLGFKNAILSLELKEEDILLLIEAFNKRNNLSIKPYVYTKGHRPLMYLNRNPFNKYINIDDIHHISNGYSSFIVESVNNYLVIKEYDLFEGNYYHKDKFFEYKEI